MSEIIFIGTCTLVLIGLVIFATIEDGRERKIFNAETELNYQECMTKESKYTCESYKNSRMAVQAAKDAASAAIIAAVSGSLAIGISASK